MKVRTTYVGICATIFVSLFSSVSFAQLSQVADRGDIVWTDTLDWSNTGGFDYWPWVYDSVINTSANGVEVLVAQDLVGGSFAGYITNDAGPGFRTTNFPPGHYYSTNTNTNAYNPVTFSNFDGVGICAFGTQIAPASLGGFSAKIEAYDDNGDSMGSFPVAGSDTDPDAAFLGVKSTDPISYVVISLENEASGIYAAWYALNKVDFNACVTEPPPEVPALSCDGFAAPMAKHPVKTKQNRVLPLKMELFDVDGLEQTAVELVAAPVVTVLFTASAGGDAIDVSNDTLSSGHGSEGNQFDFTDEGIWQFNLKSKNYSAAGLYEIMVDSGDSSEYVIDSTCLTSFVKE